MSVVTRLRAISTTRSPMSAMYEMVRSAWSIIISCRGGGGAGGVSRGEPLQSTVSGRLPVVSN